MKNLKLSGQFAIASAIFLGAAFGLEWACFGNPPRSAHFVPFNLIPCFILAFVGSVLLLATLCIFVGTVIEIIGRRLRNKTTR